MAAWFEVGGNANAMCNVPHFWSRSAWTGPYCNGRPAALDAKGAKRREDVDLAWKLCLLSGACVIMGNAKQKQVRKMM
jgi:hypothetical protein